MKKSDLTVTMPMTTFDEMMRKDNKLIELKDKLKDCFDTTAFDSGNSQDIDFSIKKAFDICKSFLPLKYSNVNINMIQE